jgi:hypothetical protein
MPSLCVNVGWAVRGLDSPSEDVLSELLAHEPLFHRGELGTERADFEAMMAADFWEIGASGRRYSRDYVLKVLEERQREPVEEQWEICEARCHRLAGDVFVVTYRLAFAGRDTQRTTVWRRVAAGWQAVFHQGTIIAA